MNIVAKILRSLILCRYKLISKSAELFTNWSSVDLVLTNSYGGDTLIRNITRNKVRAIIHSHRKKLDGLWLGRVFPNNPHFSEQHIYGYNLKKKEVFLSDLKIVPPGWWPLEFPLRILKAYAKPGWTILDPCMGRGTCGKAALQLGMNFIGLDRDPERVRMAQCYISKE